MGTIAIVFLILGLAGLMGCMLFSRDVIMLVGKNTATDVMISFVIVAVLGIICLSLWMGADNSLYSGDIHY